MLPLLLAGGIWAYNAVKIAQLANRNNQIRKRDAGDREKNLTVYHNCNFHYEDKRTYKYYNNCTFNTYIIKGGGESGRLRRGFERCNKRNQEQEDGEEDFEV